MRYWLPGPDSDAGEAAARIAEIDEHWRRHGFGDYAVLSRDADLLIGFAGLHYIAGMDEANVGYALTPTRWRQGLGSELCLRLLTHGFEELELPRIVAVVDPRNTASSTLAVRCGLRLWRQTCWQGCERLVYGGERDQWALAPCVDESPEKLEGQT